MAALEPARPLLDAVKDAARDRPESWLPRPWPPYQYQPKVRATDIFSLGRLLIFRAKVELALGRSNDAFSDLFGSLRIGQSLGTNSETMLEVLIDTALCSTTFDSLKTGFKSRAWTDSQLTTLQRLFLETRPLSQLTVALECMRAAEMQLLDDLPSLKKVGITWPPWFFHGVAQQNKVAFCRFLTSAVLPTFDPVSNRIFPPAIKRLDDVSAAVKKSHSPYLWLTSQGASNLGQIIAGIGRSENGILQATTACALERHRLAHGSYPENLTALVPTFLPTVPRDVFNGEPLRYTRTSHGSYKLTGSASNGHDEGSIWEQTETPADGK